MSAALVRARERELAVRMSRMPERSVRALAILCAGAFLFELSCQFAGPANSAANSWERMGLLSYLLFWLVMPTYDLLLIAQWLLVPITLLAITPYLATAICREHEAGTWETLRASPLTGWQIVAGKFAAGVLDPPIVRLPLAIGVLQGLTALVATVADGFMGSHPPLEWPPERLGIGAGGLLEFAVHALLPVGVLAAAGAIALLISAFARSSQTALAATLGALLVTHFAPLTLRPLLDVIDIGSMSIGSVSAVEHLLLNTPALYLALGYLPLAAALLALAAARVERREA